MGDIFTRDGTENRMRWDRRTPGFMEVWYATLNHAARGIGIWLRYTLTAPTEGTPYCEVWGFVFDPSGRCGFAGKERYEIDRLAVPDGRDDGALVRIGEAFVTEDHLEGRVMSGGRVMAWSLDIEPAQQTFQHLPPRLRAQVERRVSTLCSPNLAVPFSGTVSVGGEELTFDREPGNQSHRWGRKHSASWVWGHCSRFDTTEASVFEGLSARAALGPLPAPTATFLYLHHDGEHIAFRGIRNALLRSKSRYVLPTWAFAASNDAWRIVGAARFNVRHAIQVEYADPDGTARFCANSEIGDLAIELFGRAGSGWRHRASLTALGNAHIEFGRRQPFAELPITL